MEDGRLMMEPKESAVRLIAEGEKLAARNTITKRSSRCIANEIMAGVGESF
jgi:hypothetical protein